jgi:N-acetylneuraminic acid mutarotase
MSPLDTVEVYDPATNSWNTAAPLPTPRAPAAVAVVDGLLYVIGSWYAEEGLCSIVEAYDPTTDTWQSRAAYPDCAVSGKVDHTVASGVVGGTIVVMRDNAAADTDPPWCYRAYRYDPVANVWMGPSYSGDIEASILSGFGVINDVLYIVSGYNSGASGMLDRVVTYSLTPAQ